MMGRCCKLRAGRQRRRDTSACDRAPLRREKATASCVWERCGGVRKPIMCCGAWQFILVTYFGPPSRMTAGLQWSGCSENSESQIAFLHYAFIRAGYGSGDTVPLVA